MTAEKVADFLRERHCGIARVNERDFFIGHCKACDATKNVRLEDQRCTVAMRVDKEGDVTEL